MEIRNRKQWLDNIRIVQNVLSNEDFELFANYIRTAKVNRTPLNDAHRFMCYDEKIKEVFDTKLTELTSAIMGMPLSQHIKPIFISYVEGSLMQSHSDGFYDSTRFLTKTKGNSNLIYCAASIYLDVDCVGGDLYFDHLNYTYHPKANEMVVFPAHEIYRHRVTVVESGYRDTCLMFYASDIMLEMHKTLVQYSPFKDL